MNDLSVILQITQIAVLVCGGIFALAALRNTVRNLVTDIIDIKAELKKLADVLVTLAITSKRLDRLEEDVRDLRHGRGFIQSGVSGEYP